MLGFIFAGYVPLGSQQPYPIIVYSVANIEPILVTFAQICNFCDPNLISFYFYELTHFLHGMKNTLFLTYSTNILVCLLTVNMKNCLTPKNPEIQCDPILVTLLKMQLHYSQSSRQNATPSSGTFPLASYKDRSTLPPGPLTLQVRRVTNINFLNTYLLFETHTTEGINLLIPSWKVPTINYKKITKALDLFNRFSQQIFQENVWRSAQRTCWWKA